jgi:hypothetical protein
MSSRGRHCLKCSAEGSDSRIIEAASFFKEVEGIADHVGA